MIVVVEANVLISGLLSAHGAPARVLDLLTTGDLHAAYDDRIAAECRQVLARSRFGFQPGAVAHLLDCLFAESCLGSPPTAGGSPVWPRTSLSDSRQRRQVRRCIRPSR